MSKLIALLSTLVLAPAAWAESVAVAEVHVSVAGPDTRRVDGAALAERLRDVARRMMPESRLLERTEAAELVVTSEVIHIAEGYLASLELRRGARVVARESALGSTPEELSDAVAGAAVDLFRSRGPVAVTRPTPPPPLDVAPDLGADPNVLVALDRARTADATGEANPAAALEAWQAVAGQRGNNPFRDLADARAQQWDAYGATKTAFEGQLAKDTNRLRKLLPLASIDDAAKVDLLVLHARTYGADSATPLLALAPAPVQSAATVALGCEAGDGGQCAALARSTKDPVRAAELFERACAAGTTAACSDAGERLLRADARDVPRAIVALQRGCATPIAKACVRLARVYEEGDGADVNLRMAASLREEACSAGDGVSCRKVANALDDPQAAAALWRKGCARGDEVSCSLARLGEPAPAAVPHEALAVTAPKRSLWTARMTGWALVATGAVLGSGALLVSFGDPHGMHGDRRFAFTERRLGDDRGDTLAFALTAGALLSAGTGLAIVLGSEPDSPKLAPAPGGLVLSGKLP